MQSEQASTKSELNKSSPWLLFQVGGVGCAVSIVDVQIVISEPKLTQLPACNAEYPGVFNHAGETFQVVDLHYKFMSKPCEHAKLILSQEDDERYAYRVSSVAAVMTIEETNWLYQKELPGKIFNGVFAHADHMVLCAEIAKLRSMSPQNIEAFIKNNAAQLGVAAQPVPSSDKISIGVRNKKIASSNTTPLNKPKKLAEKNDTVNIKSVDKNLQTSVKAEHVRSDKKNEFPKSQTRLDGSPQVKTALFKNEQKAKTIGKSEQQSEQEINASKCEQFSTAAKTTQKNVSTLVNGDKAESKNDLAKPTAATGSMSESKAVVDEQKITGHIKPTYREVTATPRDRGDSKAGQLSSAKNLAAETSTNLAGTSSDICTRKPSISSVRTNVFVEEAQTKKIQGNDEQSRNDDYSRLEQQVLAAENSAKLPVGQSSSGISFAILFTVISLLVVAGLIWLIPLLVSELISKPERMERNISQTREEKMVQSQAKKLPYVTEVPKTAPPSYAAPINTEVMKNETPQLLEEILDTDANKLLAETSINETPQSLPEELITESETQMVFEPVEIFADGVPVKRPKEIAEKATVIVNAELPETVSAVETQASNTNVMPMESITPVVEMDTAVTESGSKSIVINIIDIRAKFRNSTDESDGNESTVSIPQQRIHTVAGGDTLWHIAKYYLANPYRYPELARLSKINNPDLIYPGDKVIIRISAE